MTEEEIKTLKVEAADLFFVRDAHQNNINQVNSRLVQIAQIINQHNMERNLQKLPKNKPNGG